MGRLTSQIGEADPCGTRATSAPRLVVRSTLALVIVLIAHLIELPETSRLWAEVFNAGHVVLLGAFALIVLELSADGMDGYLPSRHHHYVVAFCVTVGIGALAEIAQIPGPRDADLADVVRDAAGAFVFLGLYALNDRRLSSLWEWWGRTARVAIAAAAVIVLAFVWSPTVVWVAAFHHRNTIFPELCTFDSVWEQLFWTTRSATLERSPPPAAWATVSSGQVGRLVSRPSRRSGFALNQAYPDWSAYRFLQLGVYLEHTTSTAFTVEIADRQSSQTGKGSCKYVCEIHPAANVVLVPLESAKDPSCERPLDLRHITTVYFFTSDTVGTVTLYVDSIRLRD